MYLLFLKVYVYKRKKRPYNGIKYSTSDLRQCPNMQFQSVIENYNVKHVPTIMLVGIVII